MQKNDNKAIFSVIQKFVENWSKITYDTAFTFSSVIKQVSLFLNSSEKNMEESNASMEKSSRDISMVLTFDECFEKFNIDELYLPTNVELKRFYPKNIPKKVTDSQK